MFFFSYDQFNGRVFKSSTLYRARKKALIELKLTEQPWVIVQKKSWDYVEPYEKEQFEKLLLMLRSAVDIPWSKFKNLWQKYGDKIFKGLKPQIDTFVSALSIPCTHVEEENALRTMEYEATYRAACNATKWGALYLLDQDICKVNDKTILDKWTIWQQGYCYLTDVDNVPCIYMRDVNYENVHKKE